MHLYTVKAEAAAQILPTLDSAQHKLLSLEWTLPPAEPNPTSIWVLGLQILTSTIS
jgi:hypothetical protein